MPRQVDEHRKRAALRRIQRASDLADKGLGPPLSDWERTFLDEVAGRITTFGSAFADPAKGETGEALSGLQQAKLREISRKARGGKPGARTRNGLSSRRKPGTICQPADTGVGDEPDQDTEPRNDHLGRARRTSAVRKPGRLKKEEN
jgi:hypothetical protein